ncbi:F-box/kelch-repeat protein At3g06240-like [Castanea sativa]|uniref:F-box/kelch-repeat protein At3g06240-like n=1 Tax=Castanea sativa TaxID=21020 RepID=UPI003F6524A8
MMATTPTRFDDIPLEIAFEILSWLPGKPLLRFRCVSKCYNSIITSPDFITKHFKHNLEVKSLLLDDNNNDHLLCKPPPDPRDQDFVRTVFCNISSDHTLTEVYRLTIPVYNPIIVGISKGLFCLAFQKLTILSYDSNNEADDCSSVSRVFLWNPNIRKLKILPSTDEAFGCGFGCHHIQNNDFDFKVLIYGVFFLQSQLDFQVYTLSTDSWKHLESFNGSRGPVTWIENSPCLSFNGALHFIAYSHNHKYILSFDLHEEKFGEIMLPQNYSNGLCFKFEQLAVLEGSLALIAFHSPQQKCHIWVMRVYGDVDSWTTNIVELEEVENFFGCTGRGELLIKKSSSPHELILFDPKSLDEKNIGIGDLRPETYTANLMESLVLLNEPKLH